MIVRRLEPCDFTQGGLKIDFFVNGTADAVAQLWDSESQLWIQILSQAKVQFSSELEMQNKKFRGYVDIKMSRAYLKVPN